MERKQGKQYIIYKWSHAIISEEIKAIKSQNSWKKQDISKQSIKSMNFKLPKVPLRPWDEKLILLSQKRALWDRGGWIKIQKEVQNGGLTRTKVQMAQKCNWHENEEQKDNVVYHLLQSCGVQARNYLRIGKINLTYLASKEYSDLQYFCVTISQWIDYFSMV